MLLLTGATAAFWLAAELARERKCVQYQLAEETSDDKHWTGILVIEDCGSPFGGAEFVITLRSSAGSNAGEAVRVFEASAEQGIDKPRVIWTEARKLQIDVPVGMTIDKLVSQYKGIEIRTAPLQ